MRVCFVSEDYNMGGIQKVTHILGKEFFENNMEVYFYSLTKSVSFYDDILIESKPNQLIYRGFRHYNKKIQVKLLNSYNPEKIWKHNLNHLLHILKSKEINVIIMNGGLLTSMIPILKENYPHGVFIAWQHSSVSKYFSDYYSEILDFYKRGLSIADSVVCLSEVDLKILNEFNDNVFQIDNPTDLKPNNLTKCDKILDPKIGFVSRLDFHTKGIDYLIEIINILPDNYSFYFAGINEKQLSDEDLFLFKNIQSRVHFLGQLKESEMTKFYEEVDLIVSTSRWEGFGLGLIEAMAFGVPVVTFKNTGPLEILGSSEIYKDMIIDKPDTKAFAKKIEEVVNDELLYSELQVAGIKISNKYSSNFIYKNWINMINIVNERNK
ncbi:glycosyltransferase [Vagococcus silagei]|uniref:Glycosyltransferase n=1 Tax=Vagococcus silagei TaxID=2508885 RepID=A0A4V3TUS7_9ENTE|nr:glycosyltransferase [Vagococcus silagei]THB60159.1 glycosyltransferase [Vagococcus silagei]